MNILFVVPHFFNPAGNKLYGSVSPNPAQRIAGLSSSITSLYQCFSRQQCRICLHPYRAEPVNQKLLHDITVVICTTQESHVLDQLPISPNLYQHHKTNAEPLLLGYECQTVLKENLGQYDYYCFIEDDIIFHDPYFFVKQQWFNQWAGLDRILLPSRYEISATHSIFYKAYLDGDLPEKFTNKFQDIHRDSLISSRYIDSLVSFFRPTNPNSASFFLTASQMEYWVSQPYFLDRSSGFFGPIESASTLGVMRAFKLYKPAPENAGFLEIQHAGSRYLDYIESAELTDEMQQILRRDQIDTKPDQNEPIQEIEEVLAIAWQGFIDQGLGAVVYQLADYNETNRTYIHSQFLDQLPVSESILAIKSLVESYDPWSQAVVISVYNRLEDGILDVSLYRSEDLSPAECYERMVNR
jgi:hypothetical protein